MLNKAKQVAEQEGADVIFTGEVLGQRPMSQHRNSLDLIEKETGLKGRLLRPLSARHLPPTIVEQEGRLDRERLLSIKGRSRREQTRLADELSIDEFPQPSGGCCFLADRGFGKRFHDLIKEEEIEGRKVGREEILLLKVGRHFRLSPTVKVIVGRDEGENRFLERLRAGRWRVAATQHFGPVTLAPGSATDEEVRIASAITARYGDGRLLGPVRIRSELFSPGPGMPAEGERPIRMIELDAEPASEELLDAWRVGL